MLTVKRLTLHLVFKFFLICLRGEILQTNWNKKAPLYVKHWKACHRPLFLDLSLRHDIQHNDIQNNDTQNNDTQNNDTQHNGAQHNSKK